MKFFVVGLLLLSLSAQAQTAIEIMERSSAATKVKDSSMISTMRLIAANGQERVRKTRGFTRLVDVGQENMRLVIFEAPADVKGTKTLMIENANKDDDMWIYLPALKKVRRLVSGNKRDSFVGTDFSYGDVIGHKVHDWNYKLVGDEEFEGEACFKIESTPKSAEVQSSSGYKKRVVWINKKNFMILRADMEDVNGTPFKKYLGTKTELVDKKANKWQSMRMQMDNLQTGHKTIIDFTNFKTGAGLPKDKFTARSLETN